MHPPDVETLIAGYVVPIRPNRKFERRPSRKGKAAATSFTYRIA
jgi:hypothetical protein